ncbi:MAG: F0F1 ATP synthase subunit delta [Oscillospiraceae bacterium]|jgi:F0F1-type ATP synthase delta subunit|nr:F0F1 ATP synthase subunit delta [Oscillospiraceae bacterium]
MKKLSSVYAEALYKTANAVGAEPAVKEFAGFLEERGHTELLPDILNKFQGICESKRENMPLKLTFPFEQTPELVERMCVSLVSYGLIPQERLGEVTVDVELDKSLVGGFVAEANGKILDASIKRLLYKNA